MAILTTAQNNEQSDALFAFTHGINLDSRLTNQEIKVQKAWLQAIVDIQLMTKAEALQVAASLDKALHLMETNQFAWSIRDEDIHMHVERFVTEECGDLGKRMHVGRSRNDLIATTLRLFVADACDTAIAQMVSLINAMLDQAKCHVQNYMPGLTHLQHGQPVSIAHVMLAYTEAFLRDVDNLVATKDKALATMPLGAAALAGTPLPFDLKTLASSLGFAQPTPNSYDAVGDRDFIMSALNSFSSIALHLSRLSEDVIYWSASAVSIATLPPAWSTGSSIMPNKRNPDVPELTRGRAAHILGAQTSGHALMRTVPTSYGSDLHELKRALLLSFDQMMACLNIWPNFIQGLQFQPQRCAELLKIGHVLATEIADALVEHGIPFRDAYKIVAKLIAAANSQSLQVHELNLENVNAIVNEANFSSLKTYDFTIEKAIERRRNIGGTGASQIKTQIVNVTERLKQWRDHHDTPKLAGSM